VRDTSPAPLCPGLRAALVSVAALAAFSCGSHERSSAPSPGARANPDPSRGALVAAGPVVAAAATELAAPRVAFVAAQPWHSRMGKPIAIDPPDLANETWRVFVNQNQPIQLATPRWQPLPAQDNVEPTMPAGSRFRCLVTPLEIATDANDFGTKLKAWVLTRTLRCSVDGWHSWTEYPHKVRVAPDGTRTVVAAAEALLRQRDGAPGASAQPVRETYVLVRDDKEHREATTGPARILPGVAVDED
jgi:hypothetical protein